MTAIRTSNEPHLYWKKKYFHKNPLYFLIYADFEAFIEIVVSSRGNKTTDVYKQNLVCNGYYILFEFFNVLQSGSYETALGLDKVDWFADEAIKLQHKMSFYLENIKEDLVMIQRGEENYKFSNICQFCENAVKFDKVRDHCQLTGKYRSPAN